MKKLLSSLAIMAFLAIPGMAYAQTQPQEEGVTSEEATVPEQERKSSMPRYPRYPGGFPGIGGQGGYPGFGGGGFPGIGGLGGYPGIGGQGGFPGLGGQSGLLNYCYARCLANGGSAGPVICVNPQVLQALCN